MDAKVTFSQRIKPGISIDFSHCVNNDGEKVIIPELKKKDQVQQVEGNPATSGIVHPAFSMCIVQKNHNFPFPAAPGSLLTVDEKMIEDLSENDTWNSNKGVIRVDKKCTVDSFIRRGKNIEVHVVDETCENNGDRVYALPKECQLSLFEDGDILDKGFALNKGEVYGKGTPFAIVPLFIRYRRFYSGPGGKCLSLDGTSPKFLPSWSGDNPNFNCYHCEKRPYDKNAVTCSFTVVMTFLGGQNLDTLYKTTLRGTNREVYNQKLRNILRKASIPNSVMFLLDTKEMKNKDDKSWFVFTAIDFAKTPDWLIEYSNAAKEVVAAHYRTEAESINRQPRTQQKQYAAPEVDNNEIWSDEVPF